MDALVMKPIVIGERNLFVVAICVRRKTIAKMVYYQKLKYSTIQQVRNLLVIILDAAHLKVDQSVIQAFCAAKLMKQLI